MDPQQTGGRKKTLQELFHATTKAIEKEPKSLEELKMELREIGIDFDKSHLRLMELLNRLKEGVDKAGTK